jgi:hypothetical protein
MPSALKILHEEPGFTMGVYENVFLWAFRESSTLERIERSRAAFADLRARYPKGFGVMTIVREDAPVSMPSAARERSNAITAEFRANFVALSTVIEGSGFRSATLRSIISGIQLFARVSCPAKVFADAENAAAWMGPLCAPKGAPYRTGELAAAVQRVRG